MSNSIQHLCIYRAYDLFAISLHIDQPGLAEFFQMMRQGRCSNIKLATQITNTARCHTVEVTGSSWRAAAGKDSEYLQAMRVGQGAEDSGKFVCIPEIIFRHISKYRTILSGVQIFLFPRKSLCYGETMSERLTDEELDNIRKRVIELKIEHRDLDDAIQHLVAAGTFEELKIKRMKKRKLQLKDDIARLENTLIPDILA